MPVTTRAKWEIAGAAAALLVAAMLGSSWLASREDGIRLAATLEAQKSILTAADKRETDRDAVLKTTLAQLEDLKKQIQTPAQVVKAIPQVIPLPQPITLSIPQALAAGAPPAAAGVQPGQQAVIPAADLKPLFDFGVACKECQEKLTVSQQNEADDRVKMQALTKERDEAVTVAKGGTTWMRFKKAVKWCAIGVAIGAAGVAVAKH